MTGPANETLLTIDTHHHVLPDFFWRETENSDAPVGGLAPLRWSKETTVSFMDDAGIDVAVVSLSTPGVHTGQGVGQTIALASAERGARVIATDLKPLHHAVGGRGDSIMARISRFSKTGPRFRHLQPNGRLRATCIVERRLIIRVSGPSHE